MEAILKKEIITNKTLSRIIGVFVFINLTSFAAFVRIPLPFTPVPITLQTLFVLLSAACLGSKLGSISQLGYILLGILGLPIFAGAGSGLFYLFGPTGGYLFGFVFSTIFVGNFIKYSKNNLFFTFVILSLGNLILLSSGIIWLKVLLGYRLSELLFIGFIPFIPGDLLKVLIASILYLKLKPRLKEIF